MSRIVGLSDLKKKSEKKDGDQEMYSGGLSQGGGGSALNVIEPGSSSGGSRFDEIARNASKSGAAIRSEDVGNSKKIVMYRNGFVVDDGPLRDFSSPENKRFLQCLNDGRVPPELYSEGGAEVHIDLIDEHEKDYVPPPPPAYVAFSGGSVLGSAPVSASSLIITPAFLESIPASPLAVDESQPVTTLQVRTLGGQRLKIRLNQNATVRDVIVSIRSQYTSTDPYVMSAGYPPRDISNLQMTLTEAGLINAAVTLRKA